MPKQVRSAQDAARFKGMGLAIIELRQVRNLNKSDLAVRARVAPSTLRAIELGKADARWGTLRKLAAALRIPLGTLLEMAEERSPRTDQMAHGPSTMGTAQ